MRYSKQRELVLHTVEQLCDHPTAEEIFDKAAPECPGLSLGTVYRNLNSLVEAGRVRRVSIPGRADRFDHTLCWHSHLYCTACGGVVDADVDEKQVMRLVRRQKDVVVQDCAVKHAPKSRQKAELPRRILKFAVSHLPLWQKEGILKRAFEK